MPISQPVPTAVARRLTDARAEVAAAERALGRARDRLDSAIYDAIERRGCQVTAVADLAGLSRETVYKRFDRRAGAY